jgi:hypothetical protein
VLISIIKEILCRDLGKGVFYKELASVTKDFRDLGQRSLTEILPANL